MDEAKHIAALKEAVLNMDYDLMDKAAKEAMAARVDPLKAIMEGMSPAMALIGEKFQCGEYFLPELIVAGDVMKEGLKIIQPYLKEKKGEERKKFLIATVEGDNHDIGKNIVGMPFLSAGLRSSTWDLMFPPAKSWRRSKIPTRYSGAFRPFDRDDAQDAGSGPGSEGGGPEAEGQGHRRRDFGDPGVRPEDRRGPQLDRCRGGGRKMRAMGETWEREAKGDGSHDPAGKNPGGNPEREGRPVAFPPLVETHADRLGGAGVPQPGDGSGLARPGHVARMETWSSPRKKTPPGRAGWAGSPIYAQRIVYMDEKREPGTFNGTPTGAGKMSPPWP